MGNKSQKVIDLHHSQVDSARVKKATKVKNRLYTFEFTRIGIKAKVEADREFLALATLVFLAGLLLVTFGLVYIIGGILYG